MQYSFFYNYNFNIVNLSVSASNSFLLNHWILKKFVQKLDSMLSIWPSSGSFSICVFISLSFWMLDMVRYIDGACGWCIVMKFLYAVLLDIVMDKDSDLSIPQIFILRNHWTSLLWCEVTLEPKDRITFLIKQLPAEWFLNLNST